MGNTSEEKFIQYWQEKRLQSKFNPFLFLQGFAGGLIIGLLVFVSLIVGWYKRANMDASNKLNPIVLLVCILAIGLFIAIFYTSFKFEQNEQLYQEILKKREKQADKK